MGATSPDLRQLREIEKSVRTVEAATAARTHPMVLLLAEDLGIGKRAADMLVHEILVA